MKNSDINYFFLQGMMNSGHKGSKNSVHKGVNFHPTSTRVFRGPGEFVVYLGGESKMSPLSHHEATMT